MKTVQKTDRKLPPKLPCFRGSFLHSLQWPVSLLSSVFVHRVTPDPARGGKPGGWRLFRVVPWTSIDSVVDINVAMSDPIITASFPRSDRSSDSHPTSLNIPKAGFTAPDDGILG